MDIYIYIYTYIIYNIYIYIYICVCTCVLYVYIYRIQYNYAVPESLKTNYLSPHFNMTHNLDNIERCTGFQEPPCHRCCVDAQPVELEVFGSGSYFSIASAERFGLRTK